MSALQTDTAQYAAGIRASRGRELGPRRNNSGPIARFLARADDRRRGAGRHRFAGSLADRRTLCRHGQFLRACGTAQRFHRRVGPCEGRRRPRRPDGQEGRRAVPHRSAPVPDFAGQRQSQSRAAATNAHVDERRLSAHAARCGGPAVAGGARPGHIRSLRGAAESEQHREGAIRHGKIHASPRRRPHSVRCRTRRRCSWQNSAEI